MYAATLELCASSEVVVGLFSSWYVKAACQASGVPSACVHYYPGMIPSRSVPPFGFPAWRWLNPVGWALFSRVIDLAFGSATKRFFASKGLPKVRRALTDVLLSERLNLVATSPTLFPAPADWGALNVVCGDFVPRADQQPWEPEPALAEFLEDGEKPVLFSFGTMAHLAPERARELVLGAVKQAKVRAVVQMRGAEESGRDGDTFFVRWAPHRQLAPRCAAMVIHGGAGTTHAALRAGIPAVVVPFIFEQKLWGRLLQRAGSAAPPLPFWKATPESLGARIREVLGSQALRSRAAALASAVAREDGTGVALGKLEALAPR
ncbi:MAG: glycosyltransferase [Myxococcales bacterium]|jgi:sterol 3beta-glucosyltransferase